MIRRGGGGGEGKEREGEAAPDGANGGKDGKEREIGPEEMDSWKEYGSSNGRRGASQTGWEPGWAREKARRAGANLGSKPSGPQQWEPDASQITSGILIWAPESRVMGTRHGS